MFIQCWILSANKHWHVVKSFNRHPTLTQRLIVMWKSVQTKTSPLQMKGSKISDYAQHLRTGGSLSCHACEVRRSRFKIQQILSSLFFPSCLVCTLCIVHWVNSNIIKPVVFIFCKLGRQTYILEEMCKLFKHANW